MIQAIEKRQEQADRIISKNVVYAILVGWVPIPLLDVAAITGIQVNMVRKLSTLYPDVSFSQELGKSLIAALVGGSGTVTAASLVQMVPVYGQFAGALTVSVIGGASTYAVGRVFIQHFESGGTFLTFDPQQVREFYAKEFASGRKQIEEKYIGKKP